MKTLVACIVTVLVITNAACAAPIKQAPVEKVILSYQDLVQAARAAKPHTLLDRRVRVNIHPFGRGSDAFYAIKRDMIGFVCDMKATGFSGGTVVATITGYENQEEGGEFFTLGNCGAEITTSK